MLTGEQIRAARALLRWEQKDLAQASGVSEQTIIRLEKMVGQVSGQIGTVQAIKDALETGGVDFIPENGGGPGVRLRN
ncbi:MAG: helix-turn-helix domain-containing protein [Kiloniellales bacterium]|nr:helix-turn-helix domain-containing protein [Kiloniellales bacterium]